MPPALAAAAVEQHADGRIAGETASQLLEDRDLLTGDDDEPDGGTIEVRRIGKGAGRDDHAAFAGASRPV